MDTIVMIIGSFVFVAALLLTMVIRTLRRRSKLPPTVKARIHKQWLFALSIPDAGRRILEAEKVVDSMLNALSYFGTFADKLERAGPRLQNAEALWQAHKLRNRIAHEPGFHLNEKQAEIAMKTYEGVIKQFVDL